MTKPAPGWTIYCDGACDPNPGAGGWGVVIYKDGQEYATLYGAEEETTNNRMEMRALIGALLWISEPENRKFAKIFCDSRYVVDGYNKWRHTWKRNGWQKSLPRAMRDTFVPFTPKAPANLDLWQEIDVLTTVPLPVMVEWVRGHNMNVGNERADQLSVMARLTLGAKAAE